MTIEELSQIVDASPDLDEIVISAEAWSDLHRQIVPNNIVPATVERPAIFWFRDKKIVTPLARLTRREP